MPEQNPSLEPFSHCLSRHGISLVRGLPLTLQINTGYYCNQTCKHCHLEAGPDRREIMTLETMREVAALAGRFPFEIIDITGGAPELVAHLPDLVERLIPLGRAMVMRTNLTAFYARREELLTLYQRARVTLIASFPATNPAQTNAQRGGSVWEQSIAMLRLLNEAGFGTQPGGLALNLVSNPAGAFLPPSQCESEKKFKKDLLDKWGIRFTKLYTFANIPLGRFKKWLHASGNYSSYMEKLARNFNPATIPGLMCAHLLSVSPDGILYDCDFNQAADLPLGGARSHVAEIHHLPTGIPVMVGDHCYACAAGSGFT